MMNDSKDLETQAKELAGCISQLYLRPDKDTLSKFLSSAGSEFERDIELQFIAAKARVLLNPGDEGAWVFLLDYFENKHQVYPALCCAEAALLMENSPEVLRRHEHLFSEYNSSKQNELSSLKATFSKNAVEHDICIITATYNRPHLLRRAIESVSNQTFKDFEMIIVNDGSSEDYEPALKGVHSDEIKYLYMEHKGKCHALNLAIKESRSKYIAYLDDDDRYLPEHLQTLVGALENSKYPFVYSDGYRTVKRMVEGQWIQEPRSYYSSSSFDPCKLMAGNSIPLLCMAHRRECYEQIGLFEPDIPNVEEWDLWAKAARRYDFLHISKPTCEFELRFGPDSLSGNQLNHGFYAHLLRAHNRYLALQSWLNLKENLESNDYSYEKARNEVFRCTYDKSQVLKWFLPYLLEKKDLYNIAFLFKEAAKWYYSTHNNPRFLRYLRCMRMNIDGIQYHEALKGWMKKL